MTFWRTKKSQGDNIQLERVGLTPQEQKVFGNTAIPTETQKKMWKNLTLPTKKGTEAWAERSKQSREQIMAKYGRNDVC